MLKKINRVNKEAFKFQFTISYRELVLDCYNNWYAFLTVMYFENC